MMRWTLIILFGMACGDPPPVPSTHFFAESYLDFDSHILEHCSFSSPRSGFDSEIDPSLPAEYRSLYRTRCSLLLPDGRFTGPLPFTLQASKGDHASEVCGIRIGPAPLWAPLPLEVVLAWFKDAELAGKLRAAVGPVDYNREYEISVAAEGFHIHMEQLASRDGPHMELAIDGCGRLPAETREVRVGKRLAFREQGAPRPVRRAPARPPIVRPSSNPADRALDLTRAAGLLLQTVAATGQGAEPADGQAKLVKRGMRVMNALQAVASLSNIAPLDWRKLAPVLVRAEYEAISLGTVLRMSGLSAFKEEISADIARLDALVDPEGWVPVEHDAWIVAPPLSAAESIELARLAMRAAARSFRRELKRDRDGDRLIQAVEPVALHLAIALDALESLTWGEGGSSLVADAEALSMEMTALAETLSRAPTVGWDMAFASAFDAENELRARFNLQQMERPYTVPMNLAGARPLTPEEKSWATPARALATPARALATPARALAP